MKPTCLFIVFVYSLFTSELLSQNEFRKVEENLITQLEVYPQEKIHLHTDRDYYVPGEKIWFKVYVTDAHSHLHVTYSRYVYVELISSENTLVERVMIRQSDDMFYGYLPLTKNIPEGNYTLRAYTRYMENLGDDYFFKKNIRIGNLAKSREDGESRGKRDNRRSRENQINQTNQANHSQDYDVSFYPEGGNLLEGVFCKVAFKAINKNGYPETVSGKLTDENGDELTSVKSWYAGMGVFTYQPEPGKKYFLKCSNGRGLEKQFELPQPHSQAYALTANLVNKRITIGVQRSIHAPELPCYLLAHCRGEVLYFSAWDPQKKFLTFAEEQFPAGVIQFVLFDGQMNPLSERLVFSKNYPPAKVELRTDKEIYPTRDKVVASLSFTYSRFDPLLGHLSVAITDDKDIAVDSSTSIFSSLLLSSELKGYIENPAYFLQDDIALDYLMMTHGWRRYKIPEVVKGRLEYPQIPFQTAQQITGKVKSLTGSKPVAGSEITMLTKTGKFAKVVTTDNEGTFTFDDFEFPDSTVYLLQALDKKGSSNIQLDMGRELFPEIKYALQSPVMEMPAIDTKAQVEPLKTDAFKEKAEQRAKYEEDMWMIQLSEVEITAPRIGREKETRLQFPLNQYSDVTIGREVFEKIRRNRVADYLLSVPGIKVALDGQISIGGVSSFELSGLPLILIDGIVINQEVGSDPSPYPLENLPVDFVESIDIFKGTSASLFGARGANGVISVTTKRGGDYINKNRDFNYVVYTPLGYQKPAAFYSPKYDTLESKHSTIPDCRTTIFWKPDVVISDEGEASFEFYTSDFRTTYSVVIEGMTTDGRIVRQVEKILVQTN